MCAQRLTASMIATDPKVNDGELNTHVLNA